MKVCLPRHELTKALLPPSAKTRHSAFLESGHSIGTAISRLQRPCLPLPSCSAGGHFQKRGPGKFQTDPAAARS